MVKDSGSPHSQGQVFTLQLLVISCLLYLSSIYLLFTCFGICGRWGEDKERRNAISRRSCQELSSEGAGEGRRPPALGPLVAEPVDTRGQRSRRPSEPAGWEVQGKVRQRVGGQLLETASKMGYHTFNIKESEVAQSCPTLCNTMDCSPPGSSVHWVLQA